MQALDKDSRMPCPRRETRAPALLACVCALAALVPSAGFIVCTPIGHFGVDWQAPFRRPSDSAGRGFALPRPSQAYLLSACSRGASWQDDLGLDVLSLDDLTFDRYIGSVSYTESVTVEGSGPELTADGAMRMGVSTATVGTASVRVFQASLTDIGMLTRGDDVRVTLKEFPAAANEDDADLAANEAATLAALAGKQGGGAQALTRLCGVLEMGFAAGESDEADADWTSALGVAPPRQDSTWLVYYPYEGDGGNTLLSFARPTAERIAEAKEARAGRRSLALPPLPRDVPWTKTARFILQGIIPQALAALAHMHDGGFAHRVLSPACLQLSARQGMNKNVAIEDCDPTMLLLKLNEFGRAVALDDAPLSTPGGGLGLIAEDLRALGLIFLQLLLGALVETKAIDPATGHFVSLPPPPSVAVADLARQISLFDGRIAGSEGFAEYCRSEPAWCKVAALLDADDGAGWEFLELLMTAPSGLAKAPQSAGDAVPALRSAEGFKAHRFLQIKAQDIERAARGISGEEERPKLFGIFEW